jgi:hypothetical protein
MADVIDLTMPFNYGLFPLPPLPGRVPARPPPEQLLGGALQELARDAQAFNRLKYRAFLYAHADASWGKWLHRRFERLPDRLALFDAHFAELKQ